MNFNIDLTKDDIFELIEKALNEGAISERDVIYEIATRHDKGFDDTHRTVDKCMEVMGCLEQ